MQFLKFLAPLVMIALSLCGCKPKDDPLADYSFLTQKPCKAPCWYGLELDISGEEEVLQTIKSLPFIDPESTRKWNSVWNDDHNAVEIIFGCLHPIIKSCGSATISQNKLKNIFLHVSYSLSIESVVNIYGTPDKIGYRGFHPEAGGCILEFYWVDQDIIARYSDINNDRICNQLDKTEKLSPNIQITDISYILIDKFQFQEGVTKFLPWPGY